MLVPSSPENHCGTAVDAARDSKYCPEIKTMPRAAPRGYPPQPKPRSGEFLRLISLRKGFELKIGFKWVQIHHRKRKKSIRAASQTIFKEI